MKVLFLFGVFARIGGIEEFTRDLAQALVRQGIQVEVLCAALDNPVLDALEAAGVRVIRIPVYHGCRWNLPDRALFPFALHRAKQADVVIHQKPFGPSWYKRLSRQAKHVYITAYRPKEQFPDAAARSRFFSFFDRIFTQAEIFKADLDDPKKVRVVPYIPARPEPVQEPTVSDGILRVGMMGRLEPQKKPFQALELIELLGATPPAGFQGVEFNIYGSGSLEKELQERAAQMAARVVFHGVYVRDRVPTIVAQNDLFIITSESEGQCIVALEILAGGRPLFATPVGALPTILNAPERGALLSGTDPKAWAECVTTWLSKNSARSAKGIQESYLRDYDVETIERKYVDTLKELAQPE